MKPTHKTSGGMIIACGFWLAVVGGSTALMVRYSNTPGNATLAPTSWPTGSQIPLDARRLTLIMFVHPHCPCTQASLSELERLLAQVPDKLNTYVIVLKPAGTTSDWEKGDLWRRASAIPGVTVFTDDAGVEAHRFHAETSGQSLLYSSAGTLLFQGGITIARGHEGDNPGRTAVQDLVLEGHSDKTKTPIFGCGLFEAQCQKGDVVCKP